MSNNDELIKYLHNVSYKLDFDTPEDQEILKEIENDLLDLARAKRDLQSLRMEIAQLNISLNKIEVCIHEIIRR